MSQSVNFEGFQPADAVAAADLDSKRALALYPPHLNRSEKKGDHTHQWMEEGREMELDKLKMSSASTDEVVVEPYPYQEGVDALERPVFSAFASQTPIHEGMVFKMGRGMVKRIQKRYFVLYPGVILYYHHRHSYARDKKNGLKRGKFIRLDDVYLSKPESVPKHMKYCVVLHTPHSSNKHQDLLVAFHHKKDKNMWVELLQTQNADLGPSPSEERGEQKKVPLYIQKMRKIQYYDPKSRYHMSRFHSLPNAHRHLSQIEFESLRRTYNSFSSLPPNYSSHFSDQTYSLPHNYKHSRVSATESSTFSKMSSEIEEAEEKVEEGGIEFEVILEQENESDS